MKQSSALLVLEDGTTFHGQSFGAAGEINGEVVFNTSLTGYQEILTDPSYTGQIVVMTYPEIGNYGITPEDMESHRPFVAGLVVREYSAIPSNWRSVCSLGEYMAEHGIVGLTGIDTRKLVRHVRSQGVMRGMISTTESNPTVLLNQVKATPVMLGHSLAHSVSCQTPFEWRSNHFGTAFGQPHIVAFDFGIKFGILRSLAQRGLRVTVVPSQTTAEEVMRLAPDGIVLSNGPGDPEPLKSLSATIRKLGEHYPMMGICLGHQLLGLAYGGSTYKLKFGHRGCNHPVKNLKTGRVEITSHNHGFAVEADSLPDEFDVTYVSLNDATVEGFRHRYLPIFSVQFHPEASPGRHDANHLFDEFFRMVTMPKQELACA